MSEPHLWGIFLLRVALSRAWAQRSTAMQVRYSQDHQYIIVKDGVGTVGITNHAQEKLSDVTLLSSLMSASK